ncbi:MAG: 2-hydroxyacid dehydrogenase [Alphaproteobacteria bacterium]
MDKIELLVVARLPDYLLDDLAQDFVLHRLDAAADPDRLVADVGDRVRGALAGGMKGPDAALIAKLPKLEIIASNSVGYDATDVPAAHARGIVVTHTPDVLTDDVADLGMTLMLMIGRRIGEAERFIREGRWLQGPMPLGTKVSGKRLGIVGLGRIGTAVARRASGFGMRIAYTDIVVKGGAPYDFVPGLHDLARQSDFLLVSCVGGPTTRGLIDADVLDALGPKGFLVNIARGTIVDEAALVRALQEKRIAGAGLDVFLDEPRAPQELFDLDNVVITPHVASATNETRRAMAELVAANIRAHFAGRPVLTPVPQS